MPMPQTGNPVADELINLSPDAKSALMQGVDQHLATQQAPAQVPGAIQTSAPPSQNPVPGAIPVKAEQPPAEPPVPGAIPLPAGKPTGNMVGGMIPQANFTPQTPPHQAEFNRLSRAPLTGALAHTKADTGRSGEDQIHNPYLRIPLQILDAVGSTFLPGLAAALPGTQLHHQFLLNNAEGAAKEEQGAAESGARQDHAAAQAEMERAQAAVLPGKTAAETEHLKSQTGLANAQAKNLEEEGKHTAASDYVKVGNGLFNARSKEWEKQPTDKSDLYELSEKNGKSLGIKPDENGEYWVPKSAAGTLLKPATLETQTEKLQVGGKPHSVMVNKKTGDTIKDLGESGEKPPSVNVNAGLSALDRESTHFGKAHEKAVEAANAQLEKISEARSMLTTGNAESQALAVPKVLTALVSGQGTGVRITQPELNAISAARGLGGDFQAFISRMSSGKKLTPDQSQQLVGVLDAAAARLAQKREIANTALNGINGAKSRDEMTQLDKEARDKLAQFETGGHQAKVMVQIPGHEPAPIDADKLKAFQARYPNAKVIK